MSEILRAGVIGAGVFGGYHGAKWAGLEGARLTAVLDVDGDRAQALAGKHGALAFSAAEPFWAEVDLVSIASPAHSHAGWALAALKAGKSIYVEKPLATDPAKADEILIQARRRGLTVACGFLERAALKAAGLIGLPEAPLRLEAVRRGTPSPRNRDVSVVLDLMIHDLDLALVLARGAPFAVEADGAGAPGEPADEVRAEVTFDDGLTARFDASRLAEGPQRRFNLVYPSGTVEIDLPAGTLSHDTPFALDPAFGRTPLARDRLGASVAAFLAAARGDPGAVPLADGEGGALALDLALAVERALGA